MENNTYTFQEWINSQPYNNRKEVLGSIAEVCNVSSETVRKWVAGQYLPKPFYRSLINSIAGQELVYEDRIQKVRIN